MQVCRHESSDSHPKWPFVIRVHVNKCVLNDLELNTYCTFTEKTLHITTNETSSLIKVVKGVFLLLGLGGGASKRLTISPVFGAWPKGRTPQVVFDRLCRAPTQSVLPHQIASFRCTSLKYMYIVFSNNT